MFRRRPQGALGCRANSVVETLVADACRLDMDRHFRAIREKRPNRSFGVIADGMALVHREAAIDFEVEFDKHAIAGVARAQIMQRMNSRRPKNSPPNAITVFVVQFKVEQLAQCFGRNAPRVPEDVTRDRERKERVGALPSRDRRYPQCSEHGKVDNDIARIMRAVRGDGDRAGFVQYPALQKNEAGRGNRAS